MLDTVNLWLGKETATKTDFVAVLPLVLTEIREEGFNTKTQQQYIRGKIGNYKVFGCDSGVSLKGSLAKFYLGDNIQTLTRQDTKRAVELLSDMLHLPIGKAKVQRADIAQNYKVNYPPKAYYSYLGESRYYKRFKQPKSIYYNNSKRQIIFYDKLAEAKKKGVGIPDLYKGANLLRYELRYLNNVSQQLNQDVFANSLHNEEFYIKIIDKYYTEYQGINKIHSFNFNTESMKSPKDFFDQLLTMLLLDMGANKAIELVEELREKEVFDKAEYYSRIKKKIRQMCTNKAFTQESDLVKELNTKVKRVKRFYR